MPTDHAASDRSPRSFPYTLHTFPVRLVDGEVPAEVRQWNRAVALGFYGNAPVDAELKKLVVSEESDGRMATGAYLTDTQTPPGAWGPDYPVATYATMRKDLNVGGGTLLPAHQITAVTVRPSHRRRGILRAMMGSDLAQAKAAGIPVAALTASEATIYGRFGFGVATHKCTVEVDSRGGLDFQVPASAAQGVVEVADPTVVLELHDDVFARVHAATFGSIGRQDMYRLLISGQGGYRSMEPRRDVRAALHYDADGAVDGFVSYRVDEEMTPPTVIVKDLLAVTADAYLALWRYLGSLDLIERVSWDSAPLTDPLEWALAGKRRYQRTKVEDHLWLRILDVPAALAAREYRSDGTLIIHVGDPLGHASGIFRIEVVHGRAAVTRCPEDGSVAPELSLGISGLSSLYLGGVSAGTLARAGRIKEMADGAVAAFDALFQTPVAPHSLSDF